MNADKVLDELVEETNKKYRRTGRSPTALRPPPRNPRQPRNKTAPLKPRYFIDHPSIEYELGIDEAGRGPMFGSVYVACVVLPPPSSEFRFDWMKDSKRFSSTKKIKQIAEHIREHAVAYSVRSSTAQEIDKMNIRQAVLKTMHQCIDDIHDQLNLTSENSYLLVDGCDFINYKTPSNQPIPHKTIEGGDNWYCAIAAASILAKVSRDEEIEKLCDEYPWLDTQYGLLKNKGYGTKQHIQGIHQYGISDWHRKTFGICKQFA